MTQPMRRGIPKNFTLDYDVVPLLVELCPSSTSYGRFISGLLRTEARVREERAKVRKALEAALEPEAAEAVP